MAFATNFTNNSDVDFNQLITTPDKDPRAMEFFQTANTKKCPDQRPGHMISTENCGALMHVAFRCIHLNDNVHALIQ